MQSKEIRGFRTTPASEELEAERSLVASLLPSSVLHRLAHRAELARIGLGVLASQH